MKRIIIGLLCVLSLSCTSYNAIQYRDVDISKKSITTHPGSRHLLGLIKKYLAVNDWEIYVLSGPEKIEKITDSESLIFTDFNSNYTLLLWYDVIDIYLDGDYKYKFELSMIDNTVGMEAFTISGTGKGDIIVEKFAQLVEGTYVE